MPPLILLPGELYVHQRFGPDTTSRGAVLFECEWAGGVFESGVMLGGIFRSGDFRGGVFWAGYWKGGTFSGGLWHHGFDADGRYRARGTPPGAGPGPPALPDVPASPPANGGARVTVHTASVYPDVARIWLACIREALPEGEVAVQVFDDSPAGDLDVDADASGVTALRRAPGRLDFQEAYNDALARATTPFLAFVDTDVLWLSPDAFQRAMKELEDPRVASVSCVSRTATASHGTFAVVMRVDAYRRALRNVPGGFVPFVEREASGDLPGRWVGHDTGDLATRAVEKAGYEVKLLHLENSGAFVRFDGITITRLIGSWIGTAPLLSLAMTNPYFRRGCLGNAALASLHDRLFPDRPPYETPLSSLRLFSALLLHPRTFLKSVAEAIRFRLAARRVERHLRGRLPAVGG